MRWHYGAAKQDRCVKKLDPFPGRILLDHSVSDGRSLVPSVRKAFPAESSSAHLPLHTLSMICLRHRKISLRCYIMFRYLQKCHRRVPYKPPWERRGNSLTLLAVWSFARCSPPAESTTICFSFVHCRLRWEGMDQRNEEEGKCAY